MHLGGRFRRLGPALGFALGLTVFVSVVAAQEAPPPAGDAPSSTDRPPPPELGSVVYEDALTGPGIFDAGFRCPTGRGVRGFVGEGTLFKVTGTCTETAPSAGLASRLEQLTVPDGEIRLEFKAVNGQDRAQLRVYVRNRPSQADGGYRAVVEPARGAAMLARVSDGRATLMTERLDLAGMLAANDWNTLSIRLQGTNLWVLLNDQLALTASDPTFDSGVVWIGVTRLGDVNDDQETALVVRNLRVSGLAAGDQARLPAYQATEAAAPAGPPWIGDLKFGYDPSGSGAISPGGKLPIVDGGTFYAMFSWRNIRPGSKIGIQLIRAGELMFAREYGPVRPEFNYAIDLGTWTGGGGSGQVNTESAIYEVVVRLDGAEVLRGWVQFA